MARIESDPPDATASKPVIPEIPELAEDLTAAPVAAAAVPPEIMAQSLGQYLHGVTTRIRSGDSGVLPVLLGLVVLTLLFQIVSPHNVFLSAGNIVNLFQQSAVFMVLGMAEIFVLLLGEIDLAAGFTGAIGGVIAVQLVQPATTNLPWWIAIVAALLACALIGFVWGTLITRLRIPSFIVTLAGLLIGNGVMLWLLSLGPFSGYPSISGPQDNPHTLYELMWGTITPLVSWIGLAVIVAVVAAVFWRRDSRRRSSGLVAPPASLTLIKIALIALVGVAVVAVCSINRAAVGTLVGVPWVIAIVLVVLLVWTVLLQRTRYGRYIYAIGGNAEAARRAGVGLSRIRTWAFVLCSLTAGIAGLLYVAYLGGASNNINGGQLVLYAVAAAVIGGTSLFGGRGKVVHGVLGGLVIGVIYNGMYLLGFEPQWQYIVTGIVLIAAVTVDSLSRRSATSGSVRV